LLRGGGRSPAFPCEGWPGGPPAALRARRDRGPPVTTRLRAYVVDDEPGALKQVVQSLRSTGGCGAPERVRRTSAVDRRPGLERARVVDDPAAHYRHDRTRAAHDGVAHAEVVLVEHHQVAELADLDRPEVVLTVHVPGVAARVGVERLLTADLLARVDLLAEDVEAGGRVVHREPGVVRRDVHAVLVEAGRNAARDDLREQRPHCQAVAAGNAVEPAEPGHRHATVEALQAAQLVRGREVRVLEAPAQIRDAELRIHRLIRRDHLLDGGRAGRAAGLRVLVSPARLGHQAL